MVASSAQGCSMVRSKECFKCKSVLPLEEFYKHLMMGDGHLNKCKQCTKKDVNEHRLLNLEKIRTYDRNRAKLPHRAASNVEINRAWRAEDKRRAVAHSAVSRSIKKGDLTRLPCVKCGEVKSLAHHEDYDKPLDVMWLCQPCHKQRHKELKEEF
jgi:ribosomal protein S27AE